ncbi:unnamed protein product [Vitrella brassicaformis CCMP3155]|uniref:E2F/DP family winged-helix DNA-binding domain-containing protein n=1 Tax=Vitrella brassicaformis (strain CCMP3155) TaxID=1169540 RepID=A0A0G4GN08_VITBC|nr:unnamed protein product [Vitrella brassicaformis CCMP3155]|eukprot:CEM31582.1 unnamed protein product [Vitrella brassicaformis CCMP3155]
MADSRRGISSPRSSPFQFQPPVDPQDDEQMPPAAEYEGDGASGRAQTDSGSKPAKKRRVRESTDNNGGVPDYPSGSGNCVPSSQQQQQFYLTAAQKIDLHTRNYVAESEGKAYENGLVILTRKFFALLEMCPGQTVDLNTAEHALDVQRRRLYDIVNVLEGIGIIERVGRHSFRCARRLPSLLSCGAQMESELAVLQAENDQLDRQLAEMEAYQDRKWQLAKDQGLLYISGGDIRDTVDYRAKTIALVHAPKDASVAVVCDALPDNAVQDIPRFVQFSSPSERIHMTHISGKQYRLVVHDPSQSSSSTPFPPGIFPSPIEHLCAIHGINATPSHRGESPIPAMHEGGAAAAAAAAAESPLASMLAATGCIRQPTDTRVKRDRSRSAARAEAMGLLSAIKEEAMDDDYYDQSSY